MQSNAIRKQTMEKQKRKTVSKTNPTKKIYQKWIDQFKNYIDRGSRNGERRKKNTINKKSCEEFKTYINFQLCKKQFSFVIVGDNEAISNMSAIACRQTCIYLVFQIEQWKLIFVLFLLLLFSWMDMKFSRNMKDHWINEWINIFNFKIV